MTKRTDDTQPEIVNALRQIGAFVVDTHTLGKGFPDLVFAFRGRWYVVECKNRFLGWKLTPAQKEFHQRASAVNAEVLIFDGAESVILWAKRLNQSRENRLHVEPKPEIRIRILNPDWTPNESATEEANARHRTKA